MATSIVNAPETTDGTLARDVNDLLHCELAPMLKALGMLTGTLRALHAIGEHADADPAFAAALDRACDAPLDAIASNNCWDTVHQLASAAAAKLVEITKLSEAEVHTG